MYEPDRELYDIRSAVVRPQTAAGEDLVPVVEYDGEVLQEGVDYIWEKKNASDKFTEPGSYSIIVTGRGKYIGKATMTFVIAVPLKGDANLDGEVDITDATTIQRYDVGLISLSDTALRLSDVDDDGFVCIIDATWIQRWDLQMKAPEGIGKPI